MEQKRTFTPRQKKAIGLAAIIIFVLFCVAVGWFAGRPMLHFAQDPERFRAWVDSHGPWGSIAYMGMVFLQVLVALIPGEPLELCGGYAFGAVKGSLLCLGGAVAGSIVVFAFVRRFGRELVEVFFSREKLDRLHFLQSSPKREFLFWVIFMIPGTPKDLLCYFAGLTNLGWRKWLLICSVGRLPSLLTSTLGGDALGGQNYLSAIVIFAVTFGLSLLGLGIYHLLMKRHEKT